MLPNDRIISLEGSFNDRSSRLSSSWIRRWIIGWIQFLYIVCDSIYFFWRSEPIIWQYVGIRCARISFSWSNLQHYFRPIIIYRYSFIDRLFLPPGIASLSRFLRWLYARMLLVHVVVYSSRIVVSVTYLYRIFRCVLTCWTVLFSLILREWSLLYF